jgi:hypothetical protein
MSTIPEERSGKVFVESAIEPLSQDIRNLKKGGLFGWFVSKCRLMLF